MAFLGILLAALWLSALAVCIELMLKNSKKYRRRRQRQRQSRQYSPVASPLENRLIHLLNGDHSTAQRLVSYTRQHHPNRSEQWCREKAIHDLERDRR